MPVSSKQVSVVVQGQLLKTDKNSTLDVILSIRKHLPDAEVILSTWKGDEIVPIFYELCDKVIQSEDPGDSTHGKPPLNINRQIVSSRVGIALADREFTIKTRTDLAFNSSSILQFIGLDLKRDSAYVQGLSHICVADFTTRSHISGLKVPFWVCDFIYAGKSEDLKKIFAVELYSDELFGYYNQNKKPDYMSKQSGVFRYTPETYLTYNYLKGNRDIPFENSYDRNPMAIEYYDKLLVNNFIVLGQKQLGVDSLKYRLPIHPPRRLLTYSKWLKVYRKYFSNSLPRVFGQDIAHYVNYKINKHF